MLTIFSYSNGNYAYPVRWSDPKPDPFRGVVRRHGSWRSLRLRASNGEAVEKSKNHRLSVCTADELHFVSVPNSDWKLALWRYLPSPQAQPRNHPLLLLSGIATNAIGYDLSPESSFARYMSGNGFDTWILEVRGSGLSTHGEIDFHEVQHPRDALSKNLSSSVNHGQYGVFSSGKHSAPNLGGLAHSDMVPKLDQLQLSTKLTETFMPLSEKLSSFPNDGKNSLIATQIRDLGQWFIDIIKEGQRLVPVQFLGLQERFSTTLEDLQQQLDIIVKYDWDFDHHLEEDVPAAMEYIRTHCNPKDGKLHAIGHSMGGILLYATISKACFEGRDSGLASVTTLASSLDYTPSKSSLKLLLPLAKPAQALNVPVIPIGTLIAAANLLSSHPPYVLSWLKGQVSSKDMMDPELFEKLLLSNFCTIPAKLLLQMASAFREGGLCNRSGTFFYKDHLHKTNVPILALGGDQDLICPPEAVYETAKLIPEHMVTLKFLGELGGPHYAHYDLVGSRLAADQVFPDIIKFLNLHDRT
ncbi:hypothetical protein UlMin_008658 [Ulmus minor]